MNLDRLAPQLGTALDMLDKRFERIGIPWKQRQTADDAPEPADGLLMEILALDLNRSTCATLPHFDRAVSLTFVGQLEILDRASREQVQTVRVLARTEPSRGYRVSSHVRVFFQPPRWDAGHLINTLFPPSTFIASFLF